MPVRACLASAATATEGTPRRAAIRHAIVLIATCLAAPAQAQLSASINVESDLRHRGRTLSAARPTAAVQINYDHRSGLYVSATGIGVASRDGPDALGYQLNAGYARRIGAETSIETGVIRSKYGTNYSTGRAAGYTEGYVGVTHRQVTARAYYSPNYFYKDYHSLYGEIDAGFEPAEHWRISAHVGALKYVQLPNYFRGSRATRYDWRIGASRQFGRIEVHSALSGGKPNKQYYNYGLHNLTALTAGASFSF